MGLSSRGSHLSYICFEVTGSWPVDSLHFDGIVGCLLQEVAELKGLHGVLAKRALEGQRSLGGGSQALEHQLVVEVTKNGVRQFHLGFALADHQGQVPNLELTRLIGLEHLSLWVNLDVFVLDGELRAIDFDLLVSWVLNDNAVRHTLTNWTRQVNRLNFRVVLHSDGKGIELIFT